MDYKENNRIVPFKELTLKNDFMFTETLKDEKVCKDVIEIVTGLKIKKLSFHNDEHTYKNYKGLRGIKLDVLAVDNEKTFYDPFDRELCRYTFKPYCEEARNLALEDGSHTIFINTKGKNISDMPVELQEFIDYIERPDKKKYSDKRIEELSKRVEKVQNNQEVEVIYMTLMEKMQETYEDGREEGHILAKLEDIINMHQCDIYADVVSKVTGYDETLIEKAFELIDEEKINNAEDLLEQLKKYNLM